MIPTKISPLLDRNTIVYIGFLDIRFVTFEMYNWEIREALWKDIIVNTDYKDDD